MKKQEQHDRQKDPSGTPASQTSVTQFKQQLAGMTYEEQVEAIRPPMPLQFQSGEQPATIGSSSSEESSPQAGAVRQNAAGNIESSGTTSTRSGSEAALPSSTLPGCLPCVAIQFTGGGGGGSSSSSGTPALPAAAASAGLEWAKPVTSQSGAMQVWYLIPAGEQDSNRVELNDRNRRYYFPSRPNLETKAMEFERVLGAHAAGHGWAMEAATAMSGKVIELMTKYIEALNPGLEDATRIESLTNDRLGPLLGQSNLGYAGAVGTNGAVIREAAGKGSIREKLFMATNFAWGFGAEFINGADTAAAERFVASIQDEQTVLTQSITNVAARVQEVTDAGGTVGWRERSLTVQRPAADTSSDTAGQSASRSRSRSDMGAQRDVRAELGRTPHGGGGTRTPMTGGTAGAQGRSSTANQSASTPLRGRTEDGRGNATGPGPTAREARFQLEDSALSDSEALARVQDAQLNWGEGIRRFILSEEHPWVRAMRANSIPTGAGPSGSTQGVMQARRLLQVSTPEMARAAAIGYILPINAHSLIEILIGAEAEDGPSPVPRHFGVYLHITPFNGKNIFADDEFWAAVEGSNSELS